jgi:hypothetical protein
MKKSWPIMVGIAFALMAPSAVLAATGSFSSSTSTNALSAVNSGSGKAIGAVSNTGDTAKFVNTAHSGSSDTAVYGLQQSGSDGARGLFGYSVSQGAGRTYGVYGRTDASGDNASGLYGAAANSDGFTNGVLGKSESTQGTGVFGVGAFGVYGLGNAVGVVGDSGAIADGSYGVWSFTDMATSGHLVGSNNLAGTCTVTASTTQTCAFDNPFPAAPIVVITPAGDPSTAGAYWVVATTDHFTIHVTNAATLTFNYIVAGVDNTLSASAISNGTASAETRRERAVRAIIK